MAAPRKAASATACTGPNTPAAHSAEYSPKLSPAAAAGFAPACSSTCVTPAAKATMQGWVYRVRDRVSAGPSKHRVFKSNSTALSAASITA